MSKVSTLLTRAQSALERARKAYNDYVYYDQPKMAQPALEGTRTGRLALPASNLEEAETEEWVSLTGKYGPVEIKGQSMKSVTQEVPGFVPKVPSILQQPMASLMSPYEYQVHMSPDEREPVWETMVADYPDEALVILDRLNRRRSPQWIA